jgi:hypothetical protein
MENPNHISGSRETIFWVKILKFFDADQVSRIREWKKFGSGIMDLGWKKFGSGIQDGKNLDLESAKLEISLPNNNQPLCGKGILG